MINIKSMFEKTKLNKATEALLLVEIGGEIKKEAATPKRKPLNVGLCIDISGSMDLPLEYNLNQGARDLLGNKLNINGHINLIGNECKIPETRLDFVKKAAKKSIDSMEEDDIASLVAFEGRVHLIQEPIKMTKENKEKMKAAIDSLYTMGMTNLHGGWIESVSQVALNVSKERLNRVLVLTDGETNHGKVNPDLICEDVLKVANKSISTSTFGVSKDFNETLLSGMANSGSGNFYYISDEKDFAAMFNEEFTGMSQVCATNVKFSLELPEGVTLVRSCNTDVVENGEYLLQDINAVNDIPLLFKLDTSNASESVKIGCNLKFKDMDGNNKSMSETIEIDVVSDEEWSSLPENEAVKTQEILVIVSDDKLKAQELFKNGQRDSATQVLRSLQGTMASSGINNDSINSQINMLDQTILSVGSQSNDQLLKSMHYQSYRTKKGRKD